MSEQDDQDGFDDLERGPSRGALKREAEALQQLGAQLVALSPERLREVPMPEELAAAVAEAQRISARGGRRRQLQLIGKLMRRIDPEPIREALAHLENRSAAAIAGHHRAERWRERLLQDEEAVTEFLAEHPQADRQRLRQLIRGAQQEQTRGQPPRAFRELFRLLRDTLGMPERDRNSPVPGRPKERDKQLSGRSCWA